MTLVYYKATIFNVLSEIKQQIFKMINSDKLYLTNNEAYIMCFEEILNILICTLGKIDNIYYKYVLYPKLCNMY